MRNLAGAFAAPANPLTPSRQWRPAKPQAA